jgi:cytochrome c oxidase cbb3-type subunit III
MKNLYFILLSVPFMLLSANLQAESLEQARKLYRVYCVQCHGVEGDGYGINVADMEVLPRDHTDTEEMRARTDEDLFKAIKHGGKSVDKSVLMPNWDGNLSDKQIEMLVQLLRSLCCSEQE